MIQEKFCIYSSVRACFCSERNDVPSTVHCSLQLHSLSTRVLLPLCWLTWRTVPYRQVHREHRDDVVTVQWYLLCTCW